MLSYPTLLYRTLALSSDIADIVKKIYLFLPIQLSEKKTITRQLQSDQK